MKTQGSVKKAGFLSYLIIFCLFNLVVINGLLYVSGYDKSQVQNIKDIFLVKPTFSDSWDPMSRALKIFYSGSDPSIYQTVFFDQKHKFQYPPTSLLIIDVLHKLTGSFEDANIVIDWFSGIALWGTILFSIIIFMDAVKRDIPDESIHLKWPVVLLLVSMGLFFYPLNRAFHLGQIQVWLTFFFTLSLWLWMRNKKGLSGILIGAISVIKPQMGIFLVWGFFRKKWTFCLGIIGVAVIGLLISLIRYGWAAHLTYLDVLRFIGQRGETYFPNQSINGLVNRLLQNGNNLQWDAWSFAPENLIVSIATYSATVVFFVIALFLTLKNDRTQIAGESRWITFSIAAIAFTMASPVAWEHHYGILFPIYAVIFPRVWKLRDRWRSGLVWSGVSYILTANQYLFVNRFAETSINFIQSYLFFGALILLGVLIRMWMFSRMDGDIQNDISVD